MNCKQGDLAIVVGDAMGFHIGKIVTVTRQAIIDGVPAWHTEPKLIDPDNYGGNICAPADQHLLPIRDPGPEAVDEMVQKLGSPSKQGEMA